MKAFLMYRDRDFDLSRSLRDNAPVLIQDLELEILFEAMAAGDKYLLDATAKAVLCGSSDIDTILYRQNVLKDCLKNPDLVRELYAYAVEAIEKRKKAYWGLFDQPTLYSLLEMMKVYTGILKKMRGIADKHADRFSSEGFTALLAALQRDLDDEYLAVVHEHLNELKFSSGILISAELGEGNKGVNYILRKPGDKKRTIWERLFTPKTPVYALYIHERDEIGAKALAHLKDRGTNQVVNALGQSADHILSFFNLLRAELAFYIGCLNLHERLIQKGEAVSFPVPVGFSEKRLSFTGLYDLCLALSLEHSIVGNDLNADQKSLFIITGANQGGKSTFLRSVGIAQLMMQCGMFVPAEYFSASVCRGLFTHFKREEDATMNSGKLDEELKRMSGIVDRLRSGSMILFNESFAATNEREGSEIAGQIIRALLEKGVRVLFVTHLYDLAHSYYQRKLDNAVFLRAERLCQGQRTFKIREGEPWRTSFGQDLYNEIFEADH